MKAKSDWSAWEDDAADRLGAKKVRLSGRLQQFKGDVKTEDYLVDCKFTGHRGYVLTLSFWDKLGDWARNESRIPAIAVKTGDGHEFVVAPMQEAYHAIEREPPDSVSFNARKSKELNGARFDSEEPVAFRLGNHSLAAISFDRFARAVNRDEG